MLPPTFRLLKEPVGLETKKLFEIEKRVLRQLLIKLILEI